MATKIISAPTGFCMEDLHEFDSQLDLLYLYNSLMVMSQNIYDYIDHLAHPSNLEMKLVGLWVIFNLVLVGYKASLLCVQCMCYKCQGPY
jgi:hypothetical protein